MKKVSIIIVNWNGKNYLKICIPSLLKIDYKDFEIILVDNNSSDGSIEYVKDNFPKIKIIKNKSNLGFALANNIGYKNAKGEYILFLNNDTRVEKNFLSELVKGLEGDSNIGCVQPKIFLMDDPTRFDSIGAFLTNTGFLYHYGYNQKANSKYDKKIFLYTAKGACMLFKKEVLEKIGLFDNNFFAYFEETDLCHRVWLAGYRIMYIPTSIIYHKMGATSNQMDNSFIQFHSFKNRINCYVKNLGFIELMKILPVHIFLCELTSVAYIFKGKMKHFLAVNRAIGWNILYIKKTLEKRSHIQKKIRKVNDREFLPLIKKNIGFAYYYSLFSKDLIGYKETNVFN